MAEFTNVSHQKKFLKESELEVPVDKASQIGLVSNVSQNIKTESVLQKNDKSIMKEKIKLFKTTTELQEVIISLLRQKLKLEHINHQKHSDDLIVNVVDLTNALHRPTRVINGYPNTGIQVVKVERSFKDDIEKITKEMYINILKFKVAYNKFVSCIDDVFHNVTIKQDIDIAQMLCQKPSTSVSSFEGYVSPYSAILQTSKTVFDELDSIVKSYESITGKEMINENDGNNTDEDLNDKMKFFITVTEKAEIVYDEIKTIIFDMINISSN